MRIRAKLTCQACKPSAVEARWICALKRRELALPLNLFMRTKQRLDAQCIPLLGQ